MLYFYKRKNIPTEKENAEEVTKILRSIDNTISENHLSQSDIKNLLEDKTKHAKTTGGSCKKHNLKKDCEASSNCFWDGECDQKFCHDQLIKKLVRVMKYMLQNVIGTIWMKIINVITALLKYEYIYD